MGCQCMSTQETNTVYGGFFVRLAAYIIDIFISGIIAFIVKIPFWLLSGAFDNSFILDNFLFHHSLANIAGYLAMVMYFTLTTYYTHTTLGKYFFRLQVVSANDNWSFINVLYRESIGRFLSSLLCVGYIVLGIDKEKRGFHDMLCDTRVVYTVKMIEKRLIKEQRIVQQVQPQQPKPTYYIKND